MSKQALTDWAAPLRPAATRSPAPAPGTHAGRNFSDELGHRRAVDAPFLAWRSRVTGGESPHPADESAPHPATPDVALWRALLDESIPIDPLIEPSPSGHGAPITRPGSTAAIEVWTETELSALHALWRLAHRRARAELIQRCLDAAQWHVEHLQPDNATNHPWAIHVFAIAGERLGSFEHELHAQSMLHSSQVTLGRPDALSAHILLDAAECLEAEAISRPPQTP